MGESLDKGYSIISGGLIVDRISRLKQCWCVFLEFSYIRRLLLHIKIDLHHASLQIYLYEKQSLFWHCSLANV